METLIVQSISIFLILLFVLPRRSYRWDMPGAFALAVSFPVFLGWYGITGSGLHIPRTVAMVMAVGLGALTVSTILSSLPDRALKYLITYAAAMFLGVASAGCDVLGVVVIAGMVHAVLLFVKLKWSTSGISGNTNFAGAFLVPCFFIALHLEWYVPAAVLFAGLIKSKCRGAFLGAVVGLVFIQPIASGILVVAGVYFALKKNALASLQVRGRMWLSALKSLTAMRFFLGMGRDVGRVVFLRDPDPGNRLRRLHSDIIQGLYDGGIFYVLAYLWVGVASIMGAVASGNPFLAGAVASLMVAGLFVDTQLLHLTSLVFWILVGQINFSPVSVVVAGPMWIPAALVLAVLVGQTWGRFFFADLFYGIGFRRDDLMMVAKAHQINPRDTIALSGLVFALIQAEQNDAALTKAMLLADRYDGEKPVEVVAFLLAVAAFNVGALKTAKGEAERAVGFNPKHEGAKQLLKEIDGRLRQSI